jgi:hypothetical protein
MEVKRCQEEGWGGEHRDGEGVYVEGEIGVGEGEMKMGNIGTREGEREYGKGGGRGKQGEEGAGEEEEHWEQGCVERGWDVGGGGMGGWGMGDGGWGMGNIELLMFPIPIPTTLPLTAGLQMAMGSHCRKILLLGIM